ncbi:DUF445 domain-containing protein [Aeromicrobium massiliense]|uniref:DUF445 domain-containing protein n=1 Tax=Aeromicrobium massiliense TaxID=1464554 RepID=UPI000311FA80|nr:DUF445 domain-containing protein [Aeromicrobium massiliense]
MTSFAVPAAMSASDQNRRRGLRRMRIVATGLLLLAAVVYVATHGQDGWQGYVNAAAEAAMVGAVADWFAVTALFRHPLGVPVPHTAIIPRKKQMLGESLQEFVTDNFLHEDVVRARLADARVSERVGAWLSEPEHAHRLVQIGSRVTADALARVKPDDVKAVVDAAIVPRLREEELGPVAGQLLESVLADDAHRGLVDLALAELERWLVDHAGDVAAIIEQRAPAWTPQWLDRRVAGWAQDQALEWVRDIVRDPQHRVRRALDGYLATLADDLQHDPATRERAERLKARVLDQPQVTVTAVRLWDALRRALVEALEQPDGPLRARAVAELTALGERLSTDAAFAQRADDLLADGAAYVVDRYGHELASVISATVDRWDGKETAERIELHVGRDLQFIRINGTVVGGLVGLLIHAIGSTF